MSRSPLRTYLGFISEEVVLEIVFNTETTRMLRCIKRAEFHYLSLKRERTYLTAAAGCMKGGIPLM